MNYWPRPWPVLVAFWTKPIRAEPLALFRILLGSTFLISLLMNVAPDLKLYLQMEGA